MIIVSDSLSAYDLSRPPRLTYPIRYEINALPPPTVTSVDRETHRVHERNNPKTSGRVLKAREREGREREGEARRLGTMVESFGGGINQGE